MAESNQSTIKIFKYPFEISKSNLALAFGYKVCIDGITYNINNDGKYHISYFTNDEKKLIEPDVIDVKFTIMDKLQDNSAKLDSIWFNSIVYYFYESKLPFIIGEEFYMERANDKILLKFT